MTLLSEQISKFQNRDKRKIITLTPPPPPPPGGGLSCPQMKDPKERASSQASKLLLL